MEFKVIKAKSLEEMNEILNGMIRIYYIIGISNIIQEGKYFKAIVQMAIREEGAVLAKDALVAEPKDMPIKTAENTTRAKNAKVVKTAKKGVKHGSRK